MALQDLEREGQKSPIERKIRAHRLNVSIIEQKIKEGVYPEIVRFCAIYHNMAHVDDDPDAIQLTNSRLPSSLQGNHREEVVCG